MLNTPFSPWPSYSQEEADKAAEVILSNRVNYWTGGECREFEKEFAAWCECNYAVAVTNGTVALDLALKALNIGAGDEVITTSRTFLASASSIVTAGASPVFADVDLDTQNVSADTIEAVLTERTKAVIVVHLAGMPAEMDAIMALAEQRGFYVIEDCAQAHGCRYKGRPVGSIGHIGAWSFCQDKIMTTAGEGGMVTTNDKALWAAMWSYKDHGKSHAAVYEKAHPPGFRWLHESFGTNWRMTEVQGAIGRIQLRRMADWQARRTANAERLLSTASEFALIRSIPVPDYVTHAWYKCYLFIEPSQLAPGWSRDRIVAAINDAGVPCMQGSCSEVYNEKAFDGTGWRPATPLANAVQLGETSLMFLVHPTLTEAEMDTSCEVLQRVLTQAQR
ncbi:DegT/DnrJ/EryC1/StrS aminotransferase family protein [Ferrimonas sp. SCSIO 43195]|uniref:DegT/DnrJ/EryC1/StrS family aminotransferase n=1 Tax=Ferrimonas sp. SCSIO 43195 TaxID=2822844 RepID=UPI0020757E49|nr:DegT/DnrJ/EryC1/StrS aminotransferase family protein [Ferrimonas sp. SCSIO 43195]USD37746.1 DegT/DnrJ/EryC1/StrS aminotransferase family protein [Ferrimonas sp. SCSIO 43195]